MKIFVTKCLGQETSPVVEYVIMRLTPENIRKILERRETYQMLSNKDDALTDIVFHTTFGVHFYGYEVLHDDNYDSRLGELEHLFNRDGFVPLSTEHYEEIEKNAVAAAKDIGFAGTAKELSDLETRTDCDQLVIGSHGFFFRSALKYADEWVESHVIPYEELLK